MNKYIDFFKSEKFIHYAKEAGLGLVSFLLGFTIWILLSINPII